MKSFHLFLMNLIIGLLTLIATLKSLLTRYLVCLHQISLVLKNSEQALQSSCTIRLYTSIC